MQDTADVRKGIVGLPVGLQSNPSADGAGGAEIGDTPTSTELQTYGTDLDAMDRAGFGLRGTDPVPNDCTIESRETARKGRAAGSKTTT